jgi:hypothetical protein
MKNRRNRQNRKQRKCRPREPRWRVLSWEESCQVFREILHEVFGPRKPEPPKVA